MRQRIRLAILGVSAWLVAAPTDECTLLKYVAPSTPDHYITRLPIYAHDQSLVPHIAAVVLGRFGLHAYTRDNASVREGKAGWGRCCCFGRLRGRSCRRESRLRVGLQSACCCCCCWHAPLGGRAAGARNHAVRTTLHVMKWLYSSGRDCPAEGSSAAQTGCGPRHVARVLRPFSSRKLLIPRRSFPVLLEPSEPRLLKRRTPVRIPRWPLALVEARHTARVLCSSWALEYNKKPFREHAARWQERLMSHDVTMSRWVCALRKCIAILKAA